MEVPSQQFQAGDVVFVKMELSLQDYIYFKAKASREKLVLTKKIVHVLGNAKETELDVPCYMYKVLYVGNSEVAP